MQVPHDFPPVPKCFSHLLNVNVPNFCCFDNETVEPILSQSLPVVRSGFEPNSYFMRSLSENLENISRSIDFNSCRTSSYQEGDVFIVEDQDEYKTVKNDNTLSQPMDFKTHNNNHKGTATATSTKESLDGQRRVDEDEDCQDMNNPFVKLNSSLEKLQKEMKELRQFDVSLFYQLVNLHEAIQDVKCNVNDRFSETGSEYSLGSASYMGSMSSLDEESDWGDSQIFTHSFRGEESAADEDENRQSTSSLLEQITALTQRAEQDI